ncbi:selenium metabolism-associated LysR family transcriptional regulator [Desulfoluna spongiiphila]|uniref:DNA-binding transcriptional regulator, LysR family n=1 Tax=Desulfoluna spongiiphila TaxID=419481 RepID=A0A1G5I3Y0_9BACT|nr:selenium metabolism-associated LysR family transcriptional regulator [Desulfoluna spongiiphila]SCY70370.1 DNA-binding transcriptional regulator, LysR family [Desulfoluna spongiiphila]
MDFWQLTIFCKVVEFKSFSRAAEAIYLSQPTVSSHIKDLEEHCGFRLLDRLGKEVLPTKAGELLFSYAKRLLALRDETETALSQFRGITKGTLNLGGSTIPGGYILPSIIGRFAKAHPEVQISLTIRDTREIADGILNGDVELAVTGAPLSDPAIFQEPLFEDDMRLIVPAGHPWAKRKSIPMEMLKAEPFVTREKGSGTLKSLDQSLTDAGFNPSCLKIAARMGNTVSVCEAVKCGVGVSILSTRAVERDIQAGLLAAIAIEGVDLKRSFYLTRHKKRTPSPLADAFADFLRKAN